MINCPQTENLNILQHGEMVWNYTKKIISKQWDGLKIPEWFETNFVKIVSNLHDINILKKYNIYHDCGKPYCITYDENGKKHFPNHAQISKKTWLKYNSKDYIVANLIGWDMCLHTETAQEILKHNWNVKTTMTLLVTALAELHANASMFGGIESTSFKIKWKKIDKRGKMLIKKNFPISLKHEYVYVLVRQDLSTSQQAVQGTHAAIEATKKFNIANEEHPSVIYLGVKNENLLKKAIGYLLENEININVFTEPDIGNQVTAIATEPLSGEIRKILRKYRLLK